MAGLCSLMIDGAGSCIISSCSQKAIYLKLYSGKSQAQKHFFRSDCQNDKLIALIMHGSLFTKCSCNYVEFDMCTYVMCKNIT